MRHYRVHMTSYKIANEQAFLLRKWQRLRKREELRRKRARLGHFALSQFLLGPFGGGQTLLTRATSQQVTARVISPTN